MDQEKPKPKPWPEIVEFALAHLGSIQSVSLDFSKGNGNRCFFHGDWGGLASATGSTMQEAVERCYHEWHSKLSEQLKQVERSAALSRQSLEEAEKLQIPEKHAH